MTGLMAGLASGISGGINGGVSGRDLGREFEKGPDVVYNEVERRADVYFFE